MNNQNSIFWIQNVGYFRKSYLGDLIIAPKTFYYFPHTNVEGEDNKTSHQLGYVFDAFFLGYIIKPVLVRFSRLFDSGNSPLKKINFQPELFDVGTLQERLDNHIIETKKESVDVSEFGLPKPLRFTDADLRKVRIGYGRLRFESEYDEHDFSFNLFKTSSLKEALSKNGLLK
jgi:hypothetical protein